MLDIGQLTLDLLCTGMHVLKDPDFEKQIQLQDLEPFKIGDQWFQTPDPLERLDWLSAHQRNAVICLTDYIKHQVLKGTGADVRFNDIWAGTASNVQSFHNDYDPYWPEFTVSLNYYFDDSCEHTGGLLMFSNDGNDVIGSHYPKRGELIFLNQSNEYLHKVSPCTAQRRMISFKVAFPQLSPRQ